MASTEAPKPITVEKVIDLFTSEHSKELIERHIHALDRLSTAFSEGMPIRDLGKAESLFDLTLRLVVEEGQADFVDPLCHFLATLSRPFVRKSAADEFRASNLVSSLFTSVGRCFQEHVPAPVKLAAARMLAQHASAYGNRPSVLSLASVTEAEIDDDEGVRAFLNNQRLIARSDAVPAVVQGLAMAVGAGDVHLTGALVGTMTQFSYAAENCDALVAQGAMTVLAEALPTDVAHPIVNQCIELLWNLLEGSPVAVDMELAAALALCTRLTALLQDILRTGCRGVDKEMRNELVVLLWLLAAGETARGAVLEAGAVPVLLELAVCPELRPLDEAVRRNTCTPDPLDMQLRELVWNALLRLCDDDRIRALVLEGGLLECLLSYVDTDSDVQGQIRLEPGQFVNRRDQALNLLRFLVPHSAEAFAASRGVETTLRFLQQCDDDRGVERGLALLKVVAAEAVCLEALAQGDAVDLLLVLASDSVRPEAARTLCYVSLSLLGAGGAVFVEQFRAGGGVAQVQAELARACTRDPTLPSPLAAAALGAAWACVCPSRRSTAQFLVSDGVDALLDLLDAGALHLRALTLSFLADLLGNPKSHAFFHEWRSSRTGACAAHVLLDLWREEEVSRGFGSGTGITDMTRPLAGTGARTAWVSPTRLTYSLRDPKKLELLEAFGRGADGDSLLMKLYCCLRLVGWDSLGYLEAEDKVTLSMVKGFVKLKQGEIWSDIQAELEGAGFEPTSPDQERMDLAIQNTEGFVWEIRREQEEIERQNMRDKEQAEAVVYNRMIEQHKLDMASKQYKKDRSELSMKERQKLKQKKDFMLRSAIRPDQTYLPQAEDTRLSLEHSGTREEGSQVRISLPGDDVMPGRGGSRRKFPISVGQAPARKAEPAVLKPRILKAPSIKHILGSSEDVPHGAQRHEVTKFTVAEGDNEGSSAY